VTGELQRGWQVDAAVSAASKKCVPENSTYSHAAVDLGHKDNMIEVRRHH
jgi:hypothetical protein